MEAIEILRLSTELQTGFIGRLSRQSALSELLADIVDKTTELLRASAVTVFTVAPGRRALGFLGSQ